MCTGPLEDVSFLVDAPSVLSTARDVGSTTLLLGPVIQRLGCDVNQY